jgi:hypothetical protein
LIWRYNTCFREEHLLQHRIVCNTRWRDSVRQETASRIAIAATPSIRGNPTVKRADGNVCALSLQDNVESLKAYVQTDCQDKSAMKKRKLNHCKSRQP